MSRSEWWTLVILLGLGDLLLVMILIYLRFIWDIQCKQWNMMWREAFREDIEKLHLGDEETGQSGVRPRDLLGGL